MGASTYNSKQVEGLMVTEGKTDKSDACSQSGNFGIGDMSGGEIKDEAKVAGVINEGSSNKAEMNSSIVNHNFITIVSPSEKTDAAQPPNSSKKTVDKDCHETNNTSITFSAVGSVKTVDAKKLKSILRLLKKLSGDITIDIEDIELGSIRLILKGSQKGLERLEELFKSGELTKVLDIPVEDVSFLASQTSEDEKDLKTTERKRLAFTIAGNVEPADIAKLKAAITETSDDDEKTESDEKSRQVWAIVNQGARDRDLRGAFLPNADLRDAFLPDADLRDAFLRDAGLRDANLSDAVYQDLLNWVKADPEHALRNIKFPLNPVLTAQDILLGRLLFGKKVEETALNLGLARAYGVTLAKWWHRIYPTIQKILDEWALEKGYLKRDEEIQGYRLDIEDDSRV